MGRTARRTPSRLLPFAVLALLLGCGGPAPQMAARAPTPALPVYADTSHCLSALFGAGASFRRIEDFRHRNGCGIDRAITLASAAPGMTLGPPADMTCDLAAALTRLTRDVIQPEAARHLGQPVTVIRHFGSYNCRNRPSGHLSEHALGNAIDISGFELADGSVITIGKHWRGAGARSEFLRAVGRGACRHVVQVLGPGHDRAHRAHLHLDIGRWPICDP